MAQLTVLLLVGLPLTVPATAMAAPEPPAQVSVQIATIAPLSPGPKDTLRITGRVFERAGANLTGVQISLHLGNAIASRTELHGLRAQPVAQPIAVPKQQDLGDGKLSPGRSLPFTISKPISELDLPSAGVYPMQVTAIGRENGSYRDLDAASTFLPYIPSTETTPATPLAWLVPLTSDPSLLADGTFTGTGQDTSKRAAAIVASVAPGGRLRRLLDALGSAGAATATIDPTVIQALAITASGRYRVAGPAVPPSKPASRPASTDAAGWLTDLRAADRISLIGLPYADPDVEALLHVGQRNLLSDATQRGAKVLSLGLVQAADRLTSSVAVPPAGAVDAAGINYYRTVVKAQGLVLNADAVAATGDNPSASASVPGVATRLLLADDVLTRLATNGPGTNARLAEQEMIAELAEAHLEDRVAGMPTGTGTGGRATARPLLIAPPSGWSPPASWPAQLLADTGRISWLRQIPVSGLLSAPAEPRAGLVYPASARAAELPASTLDASAQLTDSAGKLFPRSPAKGPAEPRSAQSIIQPLRDTALAAVSSRWRGRPLQASAFRQSAQTSLQALQQQVRVVASPQVTLTSRTGRVPVTLENNLESSVDVSLVLTSLDKSRVSSDTVVRRTVRAGQKVQVEVEVRAASAGTFPVRLALFTQDGLPLGVPAQVLVRSTTYGVVATIFTVVALSVLGLAVLIRALRGIVRRSRRRRSSLPGTP